MDSPISTDLDQVVSDVPSTHLSVLDIDHAAQELSGIAHHTPLVYNELLSEQFQANIWLKREDLQVVRSYKIRGAYNMIQSLPESDIQNGVVCASAGNHAQGVAFACRKKKIKGTIFMPVTTPEQKVHQVKLFGREYVEVVLDGDTFDDAFARAKEFCEQTQAAFIPPFDHPKIIAGQGTVGKEIWEDADFNIDYIIIPVGGGGLSAGIGTYIKHYSPKTKIIIKKTIENYQEIYSDNCRIYIRPSGTEPLIRVLVEAKNQERVNSISREITNKLFLEIKKIVN